MEIQVKRRHSAIVVGGVALALIASGCSKNSGDNGGGNGDNVETRVGLMGTAADSVGPAAPVPGARNGGTINFAQQTDFDHLDPARVYVNTYSSTANLIYRQLTTYKETPKADGTYEMKLVGDLATDPGQDVNKDCKTWKFTLKDGLKYEDGSPIVAADIAYGVSRAFAAELTDGPAYIQQWLTDSKSPNDVYAGPYNGGAKTAPGITVNGDKEITFSFKSAHCDMPFAAAMTTTAPVPESKDTKVEYDSKPFSSGPYKIAEYTRDQKLVLVRNTNWDPNTDPSRHAYPESFVWTFGTDNKVLTERLMADEDKNLATYAGVDPDQVGNVAQDPKLKARTVSGTTQFVWTFNINNQHITDLNVRKALNLAFNKQHWIQLNGGPQTGTVASTLMSPTTAGWQKYDAFGVPDTGDAEKAKQLLGGKAVKIKYAYANTPTGQKIATGVAEDLKKAGFDVEMIGVDAKGYYGIIGAKDNPYDVYMAGWGADWPMGSTIIPPTLDGREIRDQGNYNSSYFNNADVNAEIDRLNGLPFEQAKDGWMALDKKIMTDYAPCVPVAYDGQFSLYGSNIGGAHLGLVSGLLDPSQLFLKS